jgi:hypothetical protein
LPAKEDIDRAEEKFLAWVRKFTPTQKLDTRRSLVLLNSFDDERLAKLKELLLAIAGDDEKSEDPECGLDLALPAAELNPLLLTLSSLVPALLDDVTPDVAVRAFIKSELLNESESNGAERILSALFADKKRLQSSVDEARLARAVLPSFEGFVARVDIRIRKDASGKILNVPVVVCRLATDTDESTWFQLTRGQLASLLRKLTAAAEDLKEAERWAGSR